MGHAERNLLIRWSRACLGRVNRAMAVGTVSERKVRGEGRREAYRRRSGRGRVEDVRSREKLLCSTKLASRIWDMFDRSYDCHQLAHSFSLDQQCLT